MHPALWRVGQRDAVYGLRPFRHWEMATGTGSSTTVVSDDFVTVKPQYVFFVDGVSVELTGTSGQLPLAWVLESITGLGTRFTVCGRTFPVVSGSDFRDSCSDLNFALLEGEALRVRSIWDAGVTNNTCSASIYGTLVPRGNIQGARIVT